MCLFLFKIPEHFTLGMRILNKKSFLFSALVGIVLFTAFYWYQPVLASFSALSLLTREEPLTELYSSALPVFTQNSSGELVAAFDFSVVNLEGREMSYVYSVYIEQDNGTKKELTEVGIALQDKEKKTLHETFILGVVQEKSRLIIALPQQGQELHFLLPTSQ